MHNIDTQFDNTLLKRTPPGNKVMLCSQEVVSSSDRYNFISALYLQSNLNAMTLNENKVQCGYENKTRIPELKFSLEEFLAQKLYNKDFFRNLSKNGLTNALVIDSDDHDSNHEQDRTKLETFLASINLKYSKAVSSINADHSIRGFHYYILLRTIQTQAVDEFMDRLTNHLDIQLEWKFWHKGIRPCWQSRKNGTIRGCFLSFTLDVNILDPSLIPGSQERRKLIQGVLLDSQKKLDRGHWNDLIEKLPQGSKIDQLHDMVKQHAIDLGLNLYPFTKKMIANYYHIDQIKAKERLSRFRKRINLEPARASKSMCDAHLYSTGVKEPLEAPLCVSDGKRNAMLGQLVGNLIKRNLSDEIILDAAIRMWHQYEGSTSLTIHLQETKRWIKCARRKQ